MSIPAEEAYSTLNLCNIRGQSHYQTAQHQLADIGKPMSHENSARKLQDKFADRNSRDSRYCSAMVDVDRACYSMRSGTRPFVTTSHLAGQQCPVDAGKAWCERHVLCICVGKQRSVSWNACEKNLPVAFDLLAPTIIAIREHVRVQRM